MDELHIVDRTERRQYMAAHSNVHVVTPGAALYSQRWRKYVISDKARETVMGHKAYKLWFRDMLKRIDQL